MFVHEFEIKTSKQDFLNDFNKKSKHELLEHRKRKPKKSWELGYYISCPSEKIYIKDKMIYETMPNYFWYVCEKGVLLLDDIPNYAGLIEICDKSWIKWTKKAPRLHNKKLLFDELIRMSRNMIYRYWDLRLKK